MTRFDLIVVGAGPAGMAAASKARHCGLIVMVLDEQPAPGGQIWRSVETAAKRDRILGPSYSEGRPIAEQFRNCAAAYLPEAKLWRIEKGIHASVTHQGAVRTFEAEAMILAT